MFEKYPDWEYHLAQAQLVFFMLGMGATLTRADFARIFRQPRQLLTAAFCHLLVVPVLAVLVSRLLSLEAGIAVGLILVAAMPGGTLSKLFTFLGRGDLAFTITLTAAFTLASIVTVPLLLRLLAFGYISGELSGNWIWYVVLDVAVFLLLPLAVGMAVGRHAPNGKLHFSRWCIRVGFVFVVIMVVGSVGSGRITPGEYGWKTPLAIILFCLLAQQFTLLPFRLLGWPRPSQLAVGIEATMRNINLALLLKAQLFPAQAKGKDPIADGVLFVILFYAVVAMVAGLCLALNFRRMARRDARRLVLEGESP